MRVAQPSLELKFEPRDLRLIALEQVKAGRISQVGVDVSMEEPMRNFALALAAAVCLAFAITPALATSDMSNARPSDDVSAKSGMTNQMLAQTQYNTKKKPNEVYKQQDQTRRRGWGGGGY
jgi:hypothetical protein